MDEEQIKALMNQGLNALHAKIQDDLAVMRNTAAIQSMITTRLIALHPNRDALLRDLHLDCEHLIGDVLTRGYPEWIVQRHQNNIERLQAYLTGLAQGSSQGTGGGS